MTDSKTLTQENKFGEDFEKQHVNNIYDKIADHFDKTRFSCWNYVKSFLDSISITNNNLKICDVGCGNGKYMMYLKDKKINNNQIFGCDMSTSLVKICTDKNLNVIQNDITKLSYKDNTFGFVICIAVLHHLSTEERRLKALSELVRITNKGGKMLITIWALNDSDEVNTKKQQITDNGKTQDVMVPWITSGKNIGNRYYHMFKQDELELLCKKLKTIKLIDSKYEKGNYNLVCEKL
jgi:ubiquinone/menaquinone biosynthesis C-methylase UbiE